MLNSVENFTINGVDMAREFNDYSDVQNRYFIVNEVSGRDSYSPELSILTPTLVDGGYASHRRLKPRVIEAIMTIKGRTYDELHTRVERLIEVLNTEGEDVEITFDDEPGRSYYGQVTDMEELEAKSRILKLRIEITCVDPYKYGDIKEVNIEDAFEVTNEGRARTEPAFELTAKKKSTFAMVTQGYDEEDMTYNLLGSPADDDVVTVDARNVVLYENGSTLSEWNVAGINMVESHFVKKVTGNMTSDDAGIRAGSYGTGDALHGPAIFKEIPPIKDFEIESTFDIISRREQESWRMGILMYDENMNTIGHMGIKDNHRSYKRRTPLGRFGPYRGTGRGSGNLIGDNQKNDKARDITLFYLRTTRVGNKIEFYIGEWLNHKHVRFWKQHYIDNQGMITGKLKYISLYIATHSNRGTPARLRFNKVEVVELLSVQEDQTPYVVFPGDVIRFDHKERSIYVNGEYRDDLVNFGGRYFDLEKGVNSITITPEDTFDSKIIYTEKFL